MDPQGHSTTGVGVDRASLSRSLYDLIIEASSFSEALCKTELPFLSIIPATKDLYGAEVELVNEEGRERRLKKALELVRNDFDYILLDCPPSLGLLTLNALTAADSLLVPLQCEYYALEGLTSLLETLKLVQKGLNPNLSLEGILLTMFDSRSRLSYQVADEVKQHFPNSVFRTVIHRNVRLSESPSHGKPALLYDVRSTGAQGEKNPLQCEYYALEGLTSLLETLKLVQKGLNPNLSLEGILLTMFDSRSRLSYQVADEVKQHFPNSVFRTVIHRNVRLSESPSHGKPALLYDVRSTGAQGYLEFARELIRNQEDKQSGEERTG